MAYRTLFFRLFMTLLLSICSLPMIAGHRQLPMSMQNMEKEIEEANKAIEEYMASLSPEALADFNRQVEEVTQMFESMSNEEFEKFLGDVFNEEAMPNFSDIPAAMIEEEIVEAPQLDAEKLKKFETALAILSDIIKQSNMFMVLIGTSPELPNRINNWANKGLISDWQQGATWETLKNDLEFFVQKLYKIQDQDLMTKDYKFLSDLIADEALYNNLIQLRTSLNTLLPIINIPEFGIQKLSSQSKNAIQDVLKKYTESLYLLTMPKALDALFEKYEPQAKKIREAEMSATKRAQEALKEPRSPADWKEAGVEPEMGYDSGYGDYGYGDYSPYYGGGYDSGYSPYYGGGYDGGYGDYGYPSASESGAGTGGRSGGGRSGGREGGYSAEDKKDKEKKEPEQEEAEEFVPSVEIIELIGKIKNNLETVNATLSGDDYPQLKNLVQHIDTEKINNDLANYILPTVVNKNIIAMVNNIKDIDKLSSKLNNLTLSTYQKEIKKVFSDNNKKGLKELSENLKLFEPETEAEKKATETKKVSIKEELEEEEETPKKVDITTLPAQKRWAYFADEKAKEELEESDKESDRELLNAITNPKDVRKIKENIDDLFKAVDSFGKKKAAKQAPKKPAAPIEKFTAE